MCVCLFVCYCSLRYLIFNEGREKGERKDHLGLKWLFSQCIPEYEMFQVMFSFPCVCVCLL